MNRTFGNIRGSIGGSSLQLALAVVLGIATTGRAQPSPSSLPGEAEVTADDVYVRSGDSLNHYTICKLKAGDRVSIVGERGEWYEILPPRGVFSLISGEFVDTGDDRTGVVNGDRVRVRSGSLLNDNKYTVQLQLDRGAEVSILERCPDGFLKIAPPQGATVWINRTYVAPVGSANRSTTNPTRTDSAGGAPNSAVNHSTQSSTAPSTADATEGTAMTTGAAETTVAGTDSPAPATGVTSSALIGELKSIDQELERELIKPIPERRLNVLLTRYRPIAEQSTDEVARQYAAGRIRQLEGAASVTEAALRLRDLDEQAARTRRDYMERRSQIPLTAVPAPAALDVQGELRESAVYAARGPYRRYRIVEQPDGVARTVAYVDIPADLPFNPDEYLGRYVGVRARSKKTVVGGVDPVPVYVAGEIIHLQPAPGPIHSGEDAVPPPDARSVPGSGS